MLTLNIFEISEFKDDFFYQNSPRRVILTEGSKEFLRGINNDQNPLEHFYPGSTSELEVALFNLWANNSINTNNRSVKSRLTFLLAGSCQGLNFSSLSILTPFLDLSQTYYINFDGVSSKRSYAAINQLYLSNYTYVPRLINKKLLNHSIFYLKHAKLYPYNQVKITNFDKIPKIQSNFRNFSTYFIYFRPFFKFLFTNETRTDNNTVPYLLYLFISTVLFIWLLIFIALFKLGFITAVWQSYVTSFNEFIAADLKDKLWILNFRRIDLELITTYLSDENLGVSKIVADFKHVLWCIFWSIKAAIVGNYNILMVAYLNKDEFFWDLGRRLDDEETDPDTIDLLDHWGFY